MTGQINVNKISARTGNTITINSGDKISGAAGSIVAPGQVIQTLTAAKLDVFSTTSQSYVDIPNMTITITPSSTSSKILFSCSLYTVAFVVLGESKKTPLTTWCVPAPAYGFKT